MRQALFFSPVLSDRVGFLGQASQPMNGMDSVPSAISTSDSQFGMTNMVQPHAFPWCWIHASFTMSGFAAAPYGIQKLPLSPHDSPQELRILKAERESS